MKGFIGGVTATVLGGMLLWLIQNYWTTRSAHRAQVLEYRSSSTDSMVVTQPIIDRLKQVQPGDIISVLNVKNAGSDEISNVDFRIRGEYQDSAVRDIDVIRNDPVDRDPPTMSIKPDGAHITYKLLRPGEGATFWVRANVVGDLKIVSDQKGVEVQSENDINDDNWQIYYIGGALLGGFMCIILGLAIGEAANKSVLRTIGFDPKEIEEAYKNASKK